MSNVICCDKCGKPIPVEELPELVDADKRPDYIAFLEGTEVAKFEDLCQPCKNRVVENNDHYINVKTRVRKTS